MWDGPALGTQRLAKDARRDEVLERAIAAGVRWLDTADVYGRETGDAERWLAGTPLPIATKGGLRLEGTRMIPDGRPSKLVEAAQRSRDRLRVDQLALWQWHAPDPRVEPASSLRGVRQILDRGIAAAVGLSNPTVAILRRALDELPVALVQVELSPLRPHAFRSGVAEEARDRGIPVVAYRPLGGPDGVRALRRDPVLAEVADRRGISREQAALAWIRGLGVIPLAGPTSPEHLDELAAALELVLEPDDRSALDARFAEVARLRVPRALRAPPPDAEGDVVVVMGTPGSGKTTRVARYPGYLRLNRDDRGGTLADLIAPLDEALASGLRRVVLDNTYASRASRSPVIEAAWRRGVPVRCEWLDTSEDDAEINVIHRILDLVGALPEPPVLQKAEPVGVIPPYALRRYRQEFEPPEVGEGFARVDRIPFERARSGERRMVLIDPRDLVDGNAPRLRELESEGFLVVSVGWEPAEPEGRTSVLDRVVARGRALGLSVVAASCPHPAGPPVCWCRKPLPGLVVQVIRERSIDPLASRCWGSGSADRSIARKLGIPLL